MSVAIDGAAAFECTKLLGATDTWQLEAVQQSLGGLLAFQAAAERPLVLRVAQRLPQTVSAEFAFRHVAAHANGSVDA